MKLYRLKEEAKKYYVNSWQDEMPLGKWREQNVSHEALEEVLSLIELDRYCTVQRERMDLYRMDGKSFTDQEKDLCEKALNGELLDVDSLDNYDFTDFMLGKNGNYQDRDFAHSVLNALKEYLKEKK